MNKVKKLKINTAILATIMLSSTILVKGNNERKIILNNVDIEKLIDEDIERQLEHHRKQKEYLDYMNTVDISNYDNDFIEFYHNGIIIINDKEYKVSDLYIEIGLKNEDKKNLFIYFKEPQEDILTHEKKDNFKRTSLMLFKNSTIFYEIYTKYKDMIKNNTLTILDNEFLNNMISSYDGAMHYEVPELVYRKIKK